MPKRQTQGSGQPNVLGGSTIRFAISAILAGAVFTTPVVHGQGLPVLTSWFLQTAGAVGATVELQFAHGQLIAAPDWQPLITPFSLAAAVVDRRDTRMGAYFYRAKIIAPAANGVTVRWWLCASSA